VTANLPRPALPVGSVDLAGSLVEIRSLSHGQALKLEWFRQEDRRADAPAYVVSCGLGISEGEAQEWLDSVTLELGQQLVDAIISLSGLDDTGNGADPKG
jgi:hypothetical protein